MLTFFDTSIHIDLLAGQLTLDAVLRRASAGPIRLSPIVASELLRGARRRALPQVETLIAGLQPIEPPSWRAAFLEVGRRLPTIFRDHEDIGLARLQNDMLLALTARHTGALLVTRDAHFSAMRRALQFPMVLLE